ncbi:MAG TPA: T9SS type A sorting domain-containing protein, partial [Bacteroidetes bacterium]|nr:T9SS type A sorting domain-containing protein [Bacteroidota bacterium]
DMKKIIGMMILVFWGTSVLMSQQYHYNYNGGEVSLNLNTGYAHLVLEGVPSPEALQSLIGDAEITAFDVYNGAALVDAIPGVSLITKGGHQAEIHFPKEMRTRAYMKRLETLMKDAHIQYASPYFTNAGSEKVGLSNTFLVKLAELGDPQILFDYAKSMKVEVLGRNRFMPEWYSLAVTTKSPGNALEMANIFFESGNFAVAEPDLMINSSLCVNDQFFGNQWGFQNTGQWGTSAGPDINACTGWANWGTGNAGTIVAVFDQGIDLAHPDLTGNLVAASFDVINGTSPSVVRGNHGTACAGIIAATRNNTIGVSGVAPNCGLMSVSHSLSFGSYTQYAAGLNWAWQNGAAVISNSWGWHPSTTSTLIDNAITNALTNGRGGLGTVVVFASGNSNENLVKYPATSNPGIIAVGAAAPCGERKNPASCDGENWGGDFGAQLDVAAPGVKVPTTDRVGAAGYNNTNYRIDFNGTSSACPHVAGLAGLIISLNPCLSQAQVSQIIEASAQKVGGYAYANTVGRPNGTWNLEMGYGLIDIDAAMQMTRELYIQNVTLTGNKTYQVHGKIFAGSNVDPSQTAGPVNINSGANVNFFASNSITMDPGFNVFLGATFTAAIINTNCSAWDPNALKVAPGTVLVDPQDLEEDVEAILAPVNAIKDLTIVPNPFNNELTLHYTLKEGSLVQARLFNFQGQEVANLISVVDQSPGQHQKTVQLGNNLPAGIYFVRMELDGHGVIKKLIKQ